MKELTTEQLVNKLKILHQQQFFTNGQERASIIYKPLTTFPFKAVTLDGAKYYKSQLGAQKYLEGLGYEKEKQKYE